MRRRCSALLLLSSGLAAPAKADDAVLTLLYYDRPPFHYLGLNQKPTGSVVERTEKALTAAGLPFIWVLRPAKRVLAEVFEGRANTCSPGWFRTPEREDSARLSDVIMTERSLVGVVRQAMLGKTSSDVRATFAAMNSILMRDHLTPGTYIGGLLAEQPPSHIQRRTNVDIPSMLATVAAGHADLAIMTEEEAGYFLPRSPSGLAIVHLTDPGPPEGRYMLCSKLTDPALIARFNAALHTP